MGISHEQPARLGLSGELPGRPTSGFQPRIDESAPAIADYELLRRVGRGAYGEVWLARNLTGSFVAVKVVSRKAFDHDRPFEREFEGIKRFEPISRSDPAQVAVLHVGRGDGFFYYVMELADDANAECGARNAKLGATPHSYAPHTLREDIKRQGRLPVAQCVQIGLALTRALAHLHKCGLVHRDVKPSNVIFVGGVPKLADIGLVASVDATRSLVGTEGFVAPEGPGTPQADLYSLGKLLYEISTGCDRKEFPALPPDIASRPDREALVELNAVVMRACQFDPHQRHGNAEAMLAEMELLRRGDSVQRERKLRQRLASFKKIALGLSGVAAVGLTATILVRGVVRANVYPDGPPSNNQQAEALCEKAMNILRYDGVAEFATAYTNFDQAIALDPNFARPYVGLLELNARESVPGLPTATTEVMRQIAEHLERLAPRLAATHVARAIVNWCDWKYPEAERSLLEAIKANPKYELGHTWYSWLLECYGRPEEGFKQLEIARKLAPSKVTVYRGIGNNYYAARDYTNAIAWYNESLRWEPRHAAAYGGIGQSLLAMGDYTNALGYLEKADILCGADEAATKERYESLRRAVNGGGIPAYWLLQRKWAESDTNATLYWKAVIQIRLGNTNRALDLLQQSFDTRERAGSYDNPLNQLLLDDCWDGVHDHPRFKKLLEEIGYEKVMGGRKREQT
jgi:serine/threonine protein kinase/Tfp pilus assembly protein PilF